MTTTKGEQGSLAHTCPYSTAVTQVLPLVKIVLTINTHISARRGNFGVFIVMIFEESNYFVDTSYI